MNLFIVFLLTGIWHGANFTFLVWGLFHGFWQVLERLFLKKVLDKNPLKHEKEVCSASKRYFYDAPFMDSISRLESILSQ